MQKTSGWCFGTRYWVPILSQLNLHVPILLQQVPTRKYRHTKVLMHLWPWLLSRVSKNYEVWEAGENTEAIANTAVSGSSNYHFIKKWAFYVEPSGSFQLKCTFWSDIILKKRFIILIGHFQILDPTSGNSSILSYFKFSVPVVKDTFACSKPVDKWFLKWYTRDT